MARQPTPPSRSARVLAENVAKLQMGQQPSAWSNNMLGRRAGISGRMVSHIVKADVNASTDMIDKLAAAFGLEGWQLLLPNAWKLKSNHRCERVLAILLEVDDDGRDHILQVAEREAKYADTKSL